MIAQLGMGAAFAVGAAARAGVAPAATCDAHPLARCGSAARSSCARRRCSAAFLLATRGAARASARPSLGAHQIAFQLFVFLALVLDAIAIAGQVHRRARRSAPATPTAARRRGAADDRLVARGRRCVIGGVLLALGDVIPRAFTSDPAVIDQAHDAVAAVRADAAGRRASSSRSTASSSAPATRATWRGDGRRGLRLPAARADADRVVGVWVGLDVLMLVRLVTCGGRFAGRRWALVGA